MHIFKYFLGFVFSIKVIFLKSKLKKNYFLKHGFTLNSFMFLEMFYYRQLKVESNEHEIHYN